MKSLVLLVLLFSVWRPATAGPIVEGTPSLTLVADAKASPDARNIVTHNNEPARTLIDVPYKSSPHALQYLDLYLPAVARRVHPLVVWVHGGGWAVGDKANVGAKAKHFTAAGYAFASVNYRLSPRPPNADPDRVRHPDHAEDVAAAIGFLVSNAAKFSIDPDHTFLMGHSAGAHIAAFVGTSDLLDDVGFDNARLRGVVALDGQAYDIPAFFERLRAERMISMYENAFGTVAENAAEDTWRLASPITLADESDPPFLFILQKRNPLRIEQTRGLATRLGQDPEAIIMLVERTHREINVNIGSIDDPAGITDRIMTFLAQQRPL